MVECEHRDKFCVVCGCYTPTGHNRKITKVVVDGFDAYFKQILQEKWYIPTVVCTYCYTCLTKKIKMRCVLLNSFTYFEDKTF